MKWSKLICTWMARWWMCHQHSRSHRSETQLSGSPWSDESSHPDESIVRSGLGSRTGWRSPQRILGALPWASRCSQSSTPYNRWDHHWVRTSALPTHHPKRSSLWYLDIIKLGLNIYQCHICTWRPQLQGLSYTPCISAYGSLQPLEGPGRKLTIGINDGSYLATACWADYHTTKTWSHVLNKLIILSNMKVVVLLLFAL